jgi:polysaccharide biosynthesis transport protein
MKVIDILRLLAKNLVLLILTPIVLAVLVSYLTRKPTYSYSSETTLYTGIASGSTVEMDKSLSFFATNTAFDNLINVVKSRETQQEVAIRLLAQHLMLENYNPKYISKQSFQNLRKTTPDYIYKLIVKKGNARDTSSPNSTPGGGAFSFESLDTTNAMFMQPSSIDKAAYEQTVKNLEAYMASNDTNFVYKLLYFNNPHYSIKAISTVNAQRIASSDLVKLKYDSDDPGICQQTLVIFTEVCIRNYKLIKENRSDAIVKYFEYQLAQASARLKVGEDKLLQFNEENNIINYYEQSKAVAVVKEDLDVDYNNKRIKLAGLQAAIKRIEEKLNNQQQVNLKSSSIIEKRNQLSNINSKIAVAETIEYNKTIDNEQLVKLKTEAERLKDEIRNSVNDLYSYGNTTEGLPVSTLLTDWIANVIEYEDTKAGLGVLGERIKEFQKQYAIYAPAGANIKRIEREISVSEQEFLEILHGLNLAKLKMQDAELSSTIKAVDPPFFPLSPNPTKRKILIIVAALVGFLIVLSSILAAEYFDDTLKNIQKVSKIVMLKVLGVYPKILLKTGSLNFPFVTNRLLEIIIQQIDLLTTKKPDSVEARTILFLSSLSNEGKTVTAGNIAWKLKKQGKKVLFLNFSREALRQAETSQIGYPETPPSESTSGFIRPQNKPSLVARLLGYKGHRIDSSSPFLQNPEAYLDKTEYMHYRVDVEYNSISSYEDIIEANKMLLDFKPEYVFIEMPPILYYSYPQQLVASADLAIILCRANRVWSDADQGAINTLKEITRQEPVVLLNGVESEVVESVLGDLPKKRSWIRRIMKNIIRLQFKSRYQP